MNGIYIFYIAQTIFLQNLYRNNQPICYNLSTNQNFAKGLIVIYRQQVLDCIDFFTAQPVQKFYQDLFNHLDLSSIPQFPSHGRKGFSSHALIRAFIVMKVEHFQWITQLLEYLSNNLIIACYCGFSPDHSLPSYSVFERFIAHFPHDSLDALMASQVRCLAVRNVISSNFVGIDSMPLFANTKLNNPNAFHKPSDSRLPAADKDCRRGAHAASNMPKDKKVYFYFGYKEHVALDCSSGLPIASITTPANVADSSEALPLLHKAHTVLPLYGGNFLADKGYDTKAIYNSVRDVFAMTPFIPLNSRNTKKTLFSNGRLLCPAGLMMNKAGTSKDCGRVRQRFYCPLRCSKDQDCPCQNPNFSKEKKRGCEQWVTLPSDFRLSIDRRSHAFKKVYKKRTCCERYNSRFKAAGNARLWVRSLAAVSNMNTLTHITLLAVAWAAVLTNRQSEMNCLKKLKCSA